MAGCLNDLGLGNLGPTKPQDYLQDSQYSEWLIEIDFVTGHRPSQSAIDLLKTRMEGLVNKDFIDVVIDDELPETNRNWNIQALLDYKRAHQDFGNTADRVVTWVAYVDGKWPGEDGATVLGVALSDHETVAIMDESIDNSGFLFVSARDVERTVLVHEFGHILGLVNNGIPMQSDHEDPNAPGHSDNSQSVMTAAVETLSGFNQINGAPPTRFDANDQADVCAAGGKC